jgi:hypothetical protein
MKAEADKRLLDGYFPYRCETNWRELAIIETWREYQRDVCVCCSDSDYPLGVFINSEEFQKLSRPEKIAAVKGFTSALQWLGTTVGHIVLTQIVKAMGEEVRDIPFAEQLTSDQEHVRLCAASLQKRIKNWQERVGRNQEPIDRLSG